MLHRNPESIIVPFDIMTHDPQDSILSVAERLAKYGGGGTSCSLPLANANLDHLHRRFAGCVLVSGCKSWTGSGQGGSWP
jgi:60 kDa SS-A/Ro ribonucleoprotein